MSELSQTRLWFMRLWFVILALTILFFQLLPLQTMPRNWVGPDLLFGVACAWSVRRPEYVPAVILAIIFLIADLLLQRPPGLWAVLALVGCEKLKTRGRSLRDASFLSEWLAVSFVMVGVFFMNRLVMEIFLIDLPGFRLSITEMILTPLFYPVIVLVTHWIMGIRKTAPGDLDAVGHRL